MTRGGAGFWLRMVIACGSGSKRRKWGTLCERTTRTGSPRSQEASSALFILSKVWSKDCTCGVQRIPFKKGENREKT